jgi:hypothetical protein
MRQFMMLFCLGLSGVCIAYVVHAQSASGAFSISRSVLAPAAPSSGGAFAMTSTVGQPTIDVSSGGAFQVKSGYLAIVPFDVIFANGFEP